VSNLSAGEEIKERIKINFPLLGMPREMARIKDAVTGTEYPASGESIEVQVPAMRLKLLWIE